MSAPLKLPTCNRCEDTGLVPMADVYGEYAGDEPCVCAAGDLQRDEMKREQLAAMIEGAEYAAWQREMAARPIDVEPGDLNAPPF